MNTTRDLSDPKTWEYGMGDAVDTEFRENEEKWAEARAAFPNVYATDEDIVAWLPTLPTGISEVELEGFLSSMLNEEPRQKEEDVLDRVFASDQGGSTNSKLNLKNKIFAKLKASGRLN